MNRVYPAVKAIIQRGERFLVIKQKISDMDTWDLPGGKVDYGESPYDTLVREVKEEVNLSVKILRPIGFFWFFRQDKGQVICTTFLCSADDEIDLTKNPTGENIIEYKWVTKDEFFSDKYVVSHNSIKKLLDLL
ncbi:MAG: NUDIX hydrolase [Parcubacteria group bacterium]